MAPVARKAALSGRAAAAWIRLTQCAVCAISVVMVGMGALAASTHDEYRVKAGFLFNFIAFTEWPAGTGPVLNLCVYGPDRFGIELDRLQGRSTFGRALAVKRTGRVDDLGDCQVVFITRPVIDNLPRVLDNLNGTPVLTVADSPGAMQQGVALNMGTRQGRVTIEANLTAARGNRLDISSKLLGLATEVKQ